MLQEASRLAAAHGLHVLRGTSPPVGQDGARDPIVDALRRALQARSPLHLRQDLHGCGWLVRLLPELAAGPIEPLPSLSIAAEEANGLGAAALVRFLSNVAGPSGTFLVLDNLQDADAAALDLLARVVQSAADVPVRIVGAYRDCQLTRADGFSSLLARLAHEDLVRHVTIRPLKRKDAAELLAHLLDGGPRASGAWRERVLEETAGVPFYLVAWAQEVRSHQLELFREEVPWAVRQSVNFRIDAAPAGVRDVLEAMAVAGGRSAYPLLVALTRYSEGQVLAALDAACRERLLQEDGQAYRFAYGAIRSVVESELSHARRLLLSRRSAGLIDQVAPTRALSPLGPSTSELEERAYHLAVLREHGPDTAPVNGRWVED
ncbi:MAG: hypothetical protein LC797_22180 [Chloroflexi bacterium]|nr:hypothetical protein [Chloroflexota bacterium]